MTSGATAGDGALGRNAMRRHWLLVMGAAVLLLAGCASTPEDPIVASYCTPVRSLLEKNAGKKANLFGFGGFDFFTQGAVLSEQDAMQVYREDQMCRKWAKGLLTDKEYQQYLILAAAQSIGNLDRAKRDGATADFQAVLEKFLSRNGAKQLSKNDLQQAMDALKAGILHSSHDPALADQRLNEAYAQLNQRLEATDALPGITKRLADVEASVQALGTEASTSREAILAELRSSHPKKEPPIDPPPGPVRADAISLYFASRSSELTADSLEKLALASAGWHDHNTVVYVYAYADCRGSKVDNEKLSTARATAVAQFLHDNGVQVASVSGLGFTNGYGNGTHDLARNRVAVVRSSPAVPDRAGMARPSCL